MATDEEVELLPVIRGVEIDGDDPGLPEDGELAPDMLVVPEAGGCDIVVRAETEGLGEVYTVLTSGGRVAATAGGPLVTSVVPVISLNRVQSSPM